MKTLIWKELRENGRWALLAMLALGGAELYALRDTQYAQQDFYFSDGITLCKKPFLLVTLFGCAATGLFLGLLQVLPELKRDRWAALLHRPMPRGRFFWGKALAGLLLYLGATGAPFAVCVWLVATPGHFATPFVPGMVQPGLADIAAGASYYFAALALALHGGRFAGRALPLFAAVHLSFFAIYENLFRVAIEASVAMATVLCLAGWGAIHARESLRRRPWLGRIAFLIAAFYGVCGVGDLAKKLGSVAGHKGEQKYANWEILESGEPARLTYGDDYVLLSATDVEGKPFADPKYRPDRIRGSTLGMNVAAAYVGDSHGWRRRRYNSSYRDSYSYLWARDPYSHPRFEQWFYMVQDDCFIGMLPLEKKEFARLGDRGFAPAGSSVPPFPKGMNSNQIGGDVLALATNESLRFAHLAERRMETITLPEPGPIYGMGDSWARVGHNSFTFQGIALSSGMAVVDTNSQVVAMLPYQHDADRWGRVSVGVLKSMDRFVLYAEPSEWIEGKIRKSMPSYVDVMNAQGEVLASYTLPPLPPALNPPMWNRYIAQRLQSPGFFFGEMLYRRIGAAFGSARLRDALDGQLRRNWKETLAIGVTLCVLALALAAITFAWARRSQLPPRRVAMWTGAVFLFGLPGFVVFWLAGERPRAVPCAACGLPRRIDQERCAHCGAAWPEQARDGTEIIELQAVPQPFRT